MMNLKRLKAFHLAIICFIQLTCFSSMGQTNIENSKAVNNSLFEEISKMDSIFFSAYNHADIDKYVSLISQDIEFFHDKNGLINSKTRIVESFKKMTETQTNTTYSIERRLIENTLEIHEIPGFGALETGIHQFIEITEDNQKLVTQAKFMHLWKKQNGNWVITKVFSYDHQLVKEKINPDKKTISLTDKQMDAYTGDYQFTPEFVLKIVREGNKLFGLAQGDKIEIIPYDIHKFLITTDNSKIEFLINEKDAVIGMEMESKNGMMKAQKITNK